MKKLALFTLAALLVAGAALGAYSNRGYLNSASGTSDIEVSWTGAAAHTLVIAPVSADVTFILNPNRADTGATFTVKAGDILTMDGIEFYGFTITRATATEVDSYWW